MRFDAPHLYRHLNPTDLRVLTAIETEMRTHEWVPVERICPYVDASMDSIVHRLRWLRRQKVVEYSKLAYEGYRLFYAGYDLLALNALTKRGAVDAVGGQVGFGKESDVFVVLQAGEMRILKLHRAGLTFKSVRRERRYIAGRRHLSWLYASRLAAQREFEALRKLYPHVAVPEPIDHNRHAIVMGMFEGVALSECTLEHPQQLFDELWDNIKKAYELGVVHADLSEYNVMSSQYGVCLIDWPQWVEADAKGARELLARDITNLCTHFQKRYRLKLDPEGLLYELLF
ncbi:MAG: RIO1 family regulatory kinase/ATPase domain-containing protein [Methermicoccaceae archaeon]